MSIPEFTKIKLDFLSLPLFDFTKNKVKFQTKINLQLRNKLIFKYDDKKTFLNFCKKVIPNIFPKIYLEDFIHLKLAFQS